MADTEQVKVEKKSTVKLWIAIVILAVIVIILILFLIRQKVINLDSKLFFFILVGVVIYLFLKYWKKPQEYDIYKMISIVANEEYKNYNRILDLDDLEVTETPKGSQKFSIFSPTYNIVWKFDPKFGTSGIYAREAVVELYQTKKEDETSVWEREFTKQFKQQQLMKDKLEHAGYTLTGKGDTANSI